MIRNLRPDSTSSHALRYLRAMDRWTPGAELAQHLGISSGQIATNLAVPLRRQLVQRRRSASGGVEWRLMPVARPQRFSIGWPMGYEVRT